MRKKIGISCIVLGLACLLVAVGFVLYNNREAKQGETAAQTILQAVQENIVEAEQLPEETAVAETEPTEMLTVPVGDYESLGILSIPVLELELPVLTDWSYAKLKYAPCHYSGSYLEKDFVIAAHNFPAHFGKLSQLHPGDLVLFTDVTGTVRCYEVVLLETLAPTAIEEMISSGFDLSLYTCTPGGSSRVTVRCRLKA